MSFIRIIFLDAYKVNLPFELLPGGLEHDAVSAFADNKSPDKLLSSSSILLSARLLKHKNVHLKIGPEEKL
jgi:hypothetical protein